jgi:hypothetical protein
VSAGTRPAWVDPAGCGCTDCLTGDAVPLDRATSAQIAMLLTHQIHDRTGTILDITVSVTASHDGQEWDLTDGSTWRQTATLVTVLAIRTEREGGTG